MVIVDAYNLLMAEGAGGLELAELHRLALGSRFSERGVVLVCDGTAHHGPATGVVNAAGRSARGVRVVYAGPSGDADGVIERMLEMASAPRRLLVVSDDRRVRKAARRVRAPWLGCLAFVERLRQDERRVPRAALPAFATDLPLDAPSVRYWLREFGVEAGASVDEEGAKAGPVAPSGEPGTSTRSRDRRSRRHLADPDVRPVATGSTELPRGEQIDPLLLDALEEWAIRMEDLDMGRWLDRRDRQ